MIALMAHQRKGVEIAREHPRFYFAHEPGCGKTIMSLAIVADAKQRGFTGKTLVLCPLSILHCAWAADARHFPQLTTVVVYSTKPAERKRLINTPGADVLITNYETFRSLADEFYATGVRRLIVDEASKAKNPTTQITKAIQRFSERCESVYMLSGTPAANGPHEWIPQIMALKPGVFGPSYWQNMFRYFVPVKRLIGDKERIIAWRQIGDGNGHIGSAWQPAAPTTHPIKAEFLEKLRSCSWSLSKAECLDLPEQTDIIREVELGATERKAYDGMLTQLRSELADGTLVRTGAAARQQKLRQITGGCLYIDGVAQAIGTSKLEALADLLDEIGQRQCIVWAEYTAEIDRIARATGATVIDGRTPGDERGEIVRAFQAGEVRRLVCHPAAAGHGITLTAASHAIYFSHSYSYETYQQSRDRIHRAGQKDPCTYWHIIARQTIDERIMRCLVDKRDAHSAIFDELAMERMESGHGSAKRVSQHDMAGVSRGSAPPYLHYSG